VISFTNATVVSLVSKGKDLMLLGHEAIFFSIVFLHDMHPNSITPAYSKPFSSEKIHYELGKHKSSAFYK